MGLGRWREGAGGRTKQAGLGRQHGETVVRTLLSIYIYIYIRQYTKKKHGMLAANEEQYNRAI